MKCWPTCFGENFNGPPLHAVITGFPPPVKMTLSCYSLQWLQINAVIKLQTHVSDFDFRFTAYRKCDINHKAIMFFGIEQRIRILGNVLVSIFSEHILPHASFCILLKQVLVIAFLP